MTQKRRPSQDYKKTRRRGGFTAMSGLIERRVRDAGEKRGFAVMRLLTHWEDIVGKDLAKMARPVKVGYGREGFGATLTLLTTGSNAPILQTQLPMIRDKVNSCYGYSAISRVCVTQTAATGFSEGQVAFQTQPDRKQKQVKPEIVNASAKAAAGVGDQDLRRALEVLGQNVMSRKSH